MKFDIIFDEMKAFEPATKEDAEVFETPLGNLKRRYESAIKIYVKESNLGMVAEVMVNYINLKQNGRVRKSTEAAVLSYLLSSKLLDETINGQGFIGLSIADMEGINGVHST